jgi:hypothetical protein
MVPTPTPTPRKLRSYTWLTPVFCWCREVSNPSLVLGFRLTPNADTNPTPTPTPNTLQTPILDVTHCRRLKITFSYHCLFKCFGTYCRKKKVRFLNTEEFPLQTAHDDTTFQSQTGHFHSICNQDTFQFRTAFLSPKGVLNIGYIVFMPCNSQSGYMPRIAGVVVFSTKLPW